MDASRYEKINQRYADLARDVKALVDVGALESMSRADRKEFLHGPLLLLDALVAVSDDMTALQEGDGWTARHTPYDVEDLKRIVRTMRSQMVRLRDSLARPR